MIRIPRALALVALIGVAPAQQRPITDISGSLSACQDGLVSPDGAFVAYRVGSSIAVVRINSGGALTLLTSTGLGSFLWSPAGGTLYAVDGNQVVAVPRIGGGGVNLGTIPGQAVWLWDVDSTNTVLFGTRFDPATQRYHAFTLPTSGTQPYQDLFDSQDELSHLRVDVTDAFLLYLQRGTVPFAPYSLMRAHVDGSNQADMLGAPIGVVADGPEWVDAGDRAVLVAAVQAGSTQVVRVDRTSQTAVPLTWAFVHQRPSVSPDGRWIVVAAVDGVGGTGPALLPVEGGGEILMFTGERFEYAGSPNADGVGGAVVWSGRRTRLTGEVARVFRADLDGEMRVWPRAELGSVLNFELPCPPNQAGAVLLGQRAAPFVLNGIRWDYDVGPNFAILGIGVGMASGPLVFQLPIPNAPVLQGLVVDFQGLRWDPAAQTGEWTRSGRFPIF